MKKIKVYIVTFRKNDILNINLESLFDTARYPSILDVTVLANHPDVKIHRKNRRKNLRVVMNKTRMPHSWGHLTRDWNFCILDAFKTYENPFNIDWCVLAQNDVKWVDGWDEWLMNNDSYDVVSQPRGDQSVSLNINAVRNCGFFDERFATLHFHEIDFFLRCILYLEDRVSINDDHPSHNFTNHPVGCQITFPNHSSFQESAIMHNCENWEESKNFFMRKWGISPLEIDKDYITKHRDELIQRDFEINWYPYFWHHAELSDIVPKTTASSLRISHLYSRFFRRFGEKI